MADPHHVEPLDSFDRFTVGAYRTGLVLGALAVGALAACWAADRADTPARAATLAAVALIVAHLHLYDRFLRWVIAGSGWLGAVLAFGGALCPEPWAGWLLDAGLGFQFVVLSAVALKERYCFRLPVVVAIPGLLAISLLPMRAGLALPTAALLAGAAIVLALLAVAKLRMPLHYDIGDKRRYQV
jgi:uncharacterized integral membrane protein